MSTIIRCPNFVGYDEITQNNQVCNQKLKVDLELVGDSVVCPKCGQVVSIKSAPREIDSLELEPLERPTSNVMQMEFDDTSDNSSTLAGSNNRCTKCGGRYSNDGVCMTCGFLEPVRSAERKHKSKKQFKTSGFQLWVKGLSSEEVSLAWIGNAFFICFAVLGFLMVAGGVLSVSIIGVLFAMLGISLLATCVAIFLKTREITKEHSADLGILLPLWLSVLAAARFLQWQNYDEKLKGRIIIDRRKHPVNDLQLSRLQNLLEAEVIDLENSNITDQGLSPLFGQNNLCCLVLRNTAVSRETAVKLQQSNPKLWIWI